MPVKPCNGFGNIIKDDLFSDEEIQFINIEFPVSGFVKSTKRSTNRFRNFGLFAV